MNETPRKGNSIFSKLKEKTKNVKHIELIIALILGAVILLVYFANFSHNTTQEKNAIDTVEKTDLNTYASELEKKLVAILSTVEGAGNVSVMISFNGEIEYVYATTDLTKTNTVSNGTTKTSTSQVNTTPTLISSSSSDEPIVIKEIIPDVLGVVVTSSGAGSTKVKMELLKVVQTLINVPPNNIEIIVGNK